MTTKPIKEKAKFADGVASDAHLRLPFKGAVQARREPPTAMTRVEGFPGHIAHRDPHNWGVDREVAMKDD